MPLPVAAAAAGGALPISSLSAVIKSTGFTQLAGEIGSIQGKMGGLHKTAKTHIAATNKHLSKSLLIFGAAAAAVFGFMFGLVKTSGVAQGYMAEFGAWMSYVGDIIMLVMAPAFDAILDLLWLIGDWLEKNPKLIALVFGGLVKIIKIFAQFFVENWDRIAAAATLALEIVMKIVEWFAGKFEIVMGFVLDAMSMLVGELSPFADAFFELMSWLADVGISALDVLFDAFLVLWDVFKTHMLPVIKELWTEFKTQLWPILKQLEPFIRVALVSSLFTLAFVLAVVLSPLIAIVAIAATLVLILGGVVVGVGLLVTGLYKLNKEFLKLLGLDYSDLERFWTKVFSYNLEDFVHDLGEIDGYLASLVGLDISGLEAFWDKIVSYNLSDFVDDMKDLNDYLLSIVGLDFSNVTAFWTTVFSYNLSDLVDDLESILDSLKGISDLELPGVEEITAPITGAGVGGKNILEQAWGGIVGGAETIGGWLGMAGGGLINEPIWGIGQSGARYRFGEAGPETISPVGAGGIGGVVHIHAPPIYIDKVDSSVEIEEAVRRAWDDVERDVRRIAGA